jgi:hypothetical protein
MTLSGTKRAAFQRTFVRNTGLDVETEEDDGGHKVAGGGANNVSA